MNTFKRLLVVVLLSVSAVGCATPPSGKADIYSVSVITYGKVVKLRAFEVDGGYTTGGLIGGAVGLYSGKGHSNESKFYRTVAASVAGALIQNNFTKRTLYEYSLRLGDGQIIQIVSEKSGAMITDCIEIAYNNSGVQRLERVIGDYCIRIR